MEKIKHKYDVIIVGAGPVGLVAANLLGQYQIKTLILEKEDHPYTYPRAIGIDDEALRILQSIGFTQDDFSTICKMSKAEYFSKSGYRHFEPDLSFKPFGYPIVSTFLQPKLEAILREKLKNYSCVTFKTKSEFLHYSEEESYISIEAVNEDKKFNFKADFLLGCDGGKSIVRKCMGLELSGAPQKESWLVVDLVDSDKIRENIDIYKNNVNFNRPIVTIGLPDGLRRFEARLDDEDVVKGDLNEKRVNEILSYFLNETQPQIIRSRVYDRYFCLSTAFSKNRAYLLGDAAHLVPPYGGQGMCSGIRDAVNLCWKIMMNKKFKTSQSLLSTYEMERRYHLMKTIDFIKSLSYNVEDKSSIVKVHEHITTEQYRKLKPAPHYENGFFIQSPYAGQLLLQPYAYTLRGRRELLDEFLGKTFAIIGINVNPNKVMSSTSAHFWNRLNCRVFSLYSDKSKIEDDIITDNVEALILENKTHFYEQDDASVFFIRPDRFILASCSINDINYITEKINNRINYANEC